MTDTYKIILLPEALADLQDIAAYIHRQSPQNSADVCDRLVRVIDSLVTQPCRFKQAGKSAKTGSPVHAVLESSFIIYYRVDAAPPAVYIMKVIRGSRRQPKRFP